MEVSRLSRSVGLDVAAIRKEQFPVTERWAWLDHATFGPPPRAYVGRVEEFARQMAGAEIPEGYGLWGEALDRVRAKAAAFVNCDVDDIAFLKNTAEAIGVVALGLDWREGDQVIAYDQAFPADVYPWMNLGPRGVELELIKDRGLMRIDLGDIEALMTPRTRVVCLELVNFSNGFRPPLADVARLCHDRGAWLVVDATQAAGALRVDVRELGCDVLVAHCYKFMMSGWGTAISYFAPHVRERLRIPEPGWKSRKNLTGPYSLVDFDSVEYATQSRRFEPGIPDLTSIFGLEAVLDFMTGLGTREIEERVLSFRAEVVGALEEAGWRVVSSQRDANRSAIVSVTRDGIDFPTLHEQMRKQRVACAVREGRMRVSVHFYNDRSDLNRLLDCLPS
jgi:selenocysteine lyase/cysteine desulfurase